jgi:hypothetical protein
MPRDKRTHGVVTSLSPFTITANRTVFEADAVEGATVGSVVSFVATTPAATRAKLVVPKPERRYVRYDGIVVRVDKYGADIRALPRLEEFVREEDDTDLAVGDHIVFEVTSDGMAVDVELKHPSDDEG